MGLNFINKAMRICTTLTVASLAVSLSAQEEKPATLTGDLDFLAVKDFKISTNFTLEDGNPVTWDGEGLHTGNISYSFVLYNCKEIPKSFEIPESPSFKFIVKDIYGNTAGEYQGDLTSTFKMIKLSNNFQKQITEGHPLLRGGNYRIQLEIAPGLFSSEQSVVLNDEAGVQVIDKITRVDSDLSPKATITTGYPYEPASVAERKTLHWTVAPAKNPSETIFEGTDEFEFDTSKPLMASDVELDLTVTILDPGEYIYTLSSDFAPASRTFNAFVYDVLKTDFSFDKPVYTLGDDNVANLKIAMSCGYPYIEVNDQTGLPTIIVTTTMDGEESKNQFTDAAWKDTDLNYTADIRVPLDKVTQEMIDEYKGEVPLNVVINFNHTNQYEGTVMIPFKHDSSAIDGIATDNRDNSGIKYYDISGRPVDAGYRGITVTSDGRKIIR